jgi:branched-subunit amino acid transport protein
VGGVAAVCTAVCAYKTKNVFVAMLLGVAIVAISRQI